MNDAARYDALLESGCDAADACPICTGDEDAFPCSEECERLVFECRKQRQIKGLRFAARQVLKIARSYAREGFEQDERITTCLARIREYRAEIRALRVAA